MFSVLSSTERWKNDAFEKDEQEKSDYLAPQQCGNLLENAVLPFRVWSIHTNSKRVKRGKS